MSLQRKTLAEMLTFTRAGTATYFGSDGLLKTAAANEPRFDYDPATLQPRGLLIEGSRTNLLLRSEEFSSASWGRVSGTITANTITAPNGAMTADTFAASSTAIPYLDQNFAITSGTFYTLSSFFKKKDVSRVSILIYGADFNSGGSNLGATFDLDTGSITAQTTTGATMTNVGGGWYRCSVTHAATATKTATFQLCRFDGASTTAGFGTYVWGAQLEAGSFATSYIPTTTAAVTRAADSGLMTGTQFSDWFNPLEGTIVADFTAANRIGSAAQGVFAIGDRSAGFAGSSAMYVGREANRVMSATSRSAGVSDVGLAAATVSDAATAKIALAYKSNDFAASLNGGAVVADTSAVVPTVAAMSIGDFTGGWQTAQNPLFGHIRRIRYWPNRLSNALLQEATA